MKWKLDENFGSRSAHLLAAAGHDAETVLQEKLGGASDEDIYAACVREGRALLTLDLDFADVLAFRPIGRARLPADQRIDPPWQAASGDGLLCSMLFTRSSTRAFPGTRLPFLPRLPDGGDPIVLPAALAETAQWETIVWQSLSVQ